MTVLPQASLQHLNTFGLDIRAAALATITSAEEAKEVLTDHRYLRLPRLILGGGSNVLFTKDFPGLVLLNRIEGKDIVREDPDHIWIRAGAGVNWNEFTGYTVENGWGGLENLSLIPGTVGAAPIQNIGAYGVELKDTFQELQAMDLADGSIRSFNLDECAFGYRDSVFKRSAKGRYLILNVTFRLDKYPKVHTRYGAIEDELRAMGVAHPTIQDVRNAVIRIRQSKLPDPAVIGNAGSFFKNPEVSGVLFESLKASDPGLPGYPAGNGQVKLAAGYLIEKCGWKGKVAGHVGMHAQQALVLVNHGGATGLELLDHARRVQASVKEKFGVDLEMEVNVV